MQTQIYLGVRENPESNNLCSQTCNAKPAEYLEGKAELKGERKPRGFGWHQIKWSKKPNQPRNLGGGGSS
jgi:hypothetical protein